MVGLRHRTLPAQVLEASPRLACHVVSQQLSSAEQPCVVRSPPWRVFAVFFVMPLLVRSLRTQCVIWRAAACVFAASAAWANAVAHAGVRRLCMK